MNGEPSVKSVDNFEAKKSACALFCFCVRRLFDLEGDYFGLGGPGFFVYDILVLQHAVNEIAFQNIFEFRDLGLEIAGTQGQNLCSVLSFDKELELSVFDRAILTFGFEAHFFSGNEDRFRAYGLHLYLYFMTATFYKILYM